MQAIKVLKNKKPGSIGFIKEEPRNKFYRYMPFLSLVCLTPWQSLFVAEQELKAIINTDPVKRMNNSFFIIVFFVSKGEIKTGNQRRTGKMAFRGEDENSMPELYFITFERDISTEICENYS